MILEAIRLLKTQEVIRLNLAEKYQIIMIDEFQDTNEAQMKLIDMIASVDSDSPNIFVVWDDDQSIYKFQGANTKNIKDFTENIREQNLSSSKKIIEVTQRLSIFLAVSSQKVRISKIFSQKQKKSLKRIVE